MAWIAAASSVFALATALLYAPLWGQDLREVVPSSLGSTNQARATDWDRRFVVWLVARNAHAFAHHPWRLFDTGTCHPAEDTLALGHPALSVGLLGAPAEIVWGDPILTYNTAVILQTLLAAFAMALLVMDWTRNRAAAMAAGLAYAFLQGKTGQVTYPFHGDTAWTLLAFFFARRLFTGGGWWAAGGFAVSTALQLATSFYTFLVAACLGAPFGLWLLRTHGVSKLRPGPTAAAAGLVMLAAWGVFSPFLEQRGAALAARPAQTFASLQLVQAILLASPSVAGLAALGLALPRSWSVPTLPGSPRVALAAGAVIAALLGSSASAYSALASWLPGLDTVRVPLFLLGGVHLAWCALAGLGAAALLDRLGRLGAPGGSATRRLALAALLVAIVFVDALRPPLPGLPARRGYSAIAVRPPAATLELYAELERLGNTGPLLEAPIDYGVARHGLEAASHSVLAQAFHRRRTSACYNSFIPEAVRALGPLAQSLPAAESLAAIRAQGFTTLVVRGTPHPADRAWRRRMARAAEAGVGLTPILSRGNFSAYAISAESP